MDARLDVFRILELNEGEALIIRNAGGIITEDEIRSLAISQGILGTEEMTLIHHTGCGMVALTDDAFKQSIQDDTASARPRLLRRSPTKQRTPPLDTPHTHNLFIPKTDQVRGFVFDIATGKLSEIAT